jgi:hypothetical protein
MAIQVTPCESRRVSRRMGHMERPGKCNGWFVPVSTPLDTIPAECSEPITLTTAPRRGQERKRPMHKIRYGTA